MPNYDAGHYFLTALAPVRLDSILIGQQSHSRRHLIREVLAAMPVGERTVATRGTGIVGPFARTTRTHFARFVVLDDVVFNGRVSQNTLIALIQKINPLTPQPVDRVSCPFLIFAADFDADSDTDDALRGYLTELWTSMRDELTSVFQHCVGFDEIKSPDAFFDYIKRCQIETTMPFNDYWSAPPALSDWNVLAYAIGAGATLLASVAGAFVWRPWQLFCGLLAFALVAAPAVASFVSKARAPFPKSAAPAPSSDLPTILKALFLQRAFTRLAIHTQGQTDQAIYEAFGAFVTDNRPLDIAAPTQAPGVIGT